MELSNIKILSFLVLAPYIFGTSPVDSTYSEYSFGIGSGQYASHDCSGNIDRNSIVDAGVKITHKFESPFRIGIGASIASLNGEKKKFIYPDIAFDNNYGSIGTTGVRFGPESGPFLEFSFLDQVPFYTGKGCLRTGVCINPLDNTKLWLGMNTGPYNKIGFAGQFDFPITNNQFLFLNGRYGESDGIPEYGFSIGTRIRIK
jgi:hypothetical protein